MKIILNGWVEEIRDKGKIKFIILHTLDYDYQITVKKGEVSDDVFRTVEKLTRQSAITVVGRLVEKTISKIGREIIPEKIIIQGLSEPILPIDPSGKTPYELDKKLNWRFLDFRNHLTLAIFRIQRTILKAFREFFLEKNFMEIQPPLIISTASEGGAELFSVEYFDKQAFLAQSPQLYKQMAAISFEKVFCITPVFRAEKHNTPYHLNEIRQMDIEVAFIKNEEDVMKYLEEVIVHILRSVKKENEDDLKILNSQIEILETPFPRIKYKKAIDTLKEIDENIKFGDDISRKHEKFLCEKFGDIIFLTKWPSELKPFYTMPEEPGKNEEITRAFDLLYKGLEISSGSQRIHLPDLLKRKIREKGLNEKQFEFYINAFRYGAPPHGGWSIGLERLTMKICGLKNIREAAMWPRDRFRLEP